MSKINIILENKVFLKLMLSKNVNNKICAPKLILFNENFFWKDSDNFWRKKFTLKVKNFQFLTTFTQLNARIKEFLRGWLLVLGLKKCLVECATLCVKSEVMLDTHLLVLHYLQLFNVSQLLYMALICYINPCEGTNWQRGLFSSRV